MERRRPAPVRGIHLDAHGRAPFRPRVPPGERIYAVGDLHGRVDLFEELVGCLRRDSAARGPARVRLVLIGDLVDRGPDAAELVRRCMAFVGRTDRLVVLRGNHEALMVQALTGDTVAMARWLRVGGRATLESWGVEPALLDEDALPKLLRAARERIALSVIDWLGRLPLTHRAGDYLFVHAGIRPEVALADQQESDLLWIRDEFLHSEADHSAVVVHGHSISATVEQRPNRIGIDTGAFRTGVLSALALEDDRRWVLATGRGAG